MLKLNSSVKTLTGVGERYVQRLTHLEIGTIEDLLHHYPVRYIDYSIISPINRLQVDEVVTIHGSVLNIQNQYRRNRRSFQRAIIADKTGQIQVIWFNQTYLINSLKKGTKVSLSGKIDKFHSQKTLTSPEFEIIRADQKPTHTGRIVGIYPETQGLSSKWLRAKIKTALKIISPQIEEFLPDKILNQEKLIGQRKALRQIHFPPSPKEYQLARYRLAFNEMLLPQIAALKQKKQWQKTRQASPLKFPSQKIKTFIKSLSFRLTGAQQKAWQDIAKDLVKTQPMNRLLCGDVGSGKTIIAAIGAYACFLSNQKTILMAPTEMLAQQHYQTLKKLFGKKLQIGLQTSRKKKNHQKSNILVGTHSLLYQRKIVTQSSLIIIDEQHRFGTDQRARLIKPNAKKIYPHVLTMTATPIPRSIALVTHGHLDLSYLDEMPQGRKKVKTWIVPNIKREAAYQWINKQIKEHHSQAFIICPLIEESQKEIMKNVRAVTKEYKKLQKEIFPHLKLGLLHGQLKGEKKDKIIKKFNQGKIDILVATPVVEVGIDIPNATIMVVEGAHRFGLAQLHQLRGRVGRGAKQSYCLLFAPASAGKKSRRRLKILEKTNLGFELAQKDLEQRGPGKIFGTAQHGFTQFKLADLGDRKMIQKTNRAAHQILKRKISSSLKKSLKKYTIGQVEPN